MKPCHMIKFMNSRFVFVQISLIIIMSKQLNLTKKSRIVIKIPIKERGMHNSRFITITNSWLGKNEIFCLRFVWNLVWWILIPIPPTIPNFSWIGGSLFLVQNYDTRCLCNLFSVCGTRVLFFVEFTNTVTVPHLVV